MDYYKLFFNLSEQYNCIDFTCSTNYDDYELLQIEYDPTVEFDCPIVFDIDATSGGNELDLNLSQGGSVIVSHRFKEVYGEEDFKYFPIVSSEYTLASRYYLLGFRHLLDCLDEERSEVSFWTKEDAHFNPLLIGTYRAIQNVTISQPKAQGVHAFRLSKATEEMFVSDAFVRRFNDNSLQGARFTKVKVHDGSKG